ncbi:conserved hypothetical protein [Candidatus Zixiibacteriota bacterium]|nr:conserved hypothetical protein [candidate division Zixibacteria bacterium]
MKKSLNRILIVWGFLIIISALLGRASIASDNGRASADFLNIGVGARAASMGEAYSAIANDANAAYWNPAGLVSVKSPQLTFSHFAWYQDITFDYLAASFPMGNRLNITASAQYMNYGKIEGYDEQDNPTGDIGSTYDFAGAISFGYKLTDNFSAGMGIRYVAISLANLKGTALAGDVGMRYSAGNAIFGLSLSNVGQDLKFDQEKSHLPAKIRGGLALLPFGPNFIASIEGEKPLYGDMAIHNGYELKFEDRYFLRAGYSFFPRQNDRQFGQGISLGAGAILGPTQFDYSFTPKENFSSESIHRFSVSLNLNK